MKMLNLEVNIKFDQKIVSDEDINEVIKNVLEALHTKTQESSLAPWEGENHTTHIQVKEPYSQQSHSISLD